MFIENCAAYQIADGTHSNAGDNAMLIAIADPGTNHPAPKASFKVVKRFHFFDTEDVSKGAITDQQANEIYSALKYALKNKMNVIVHCVMGVCRSGAVAEVGTILGFEDTGKWRQPNLLVKQKLIACMMKEVH
jgi:predicted protein tyrosine phosphatase